MYIEYSHTTGTITIVTSLADNTIMSAVSSLEMYSDYDNS